MKKAIPAANPDAYVAALDGWRRRAVVGLRNAVRKAAAFDESIKWGNLFYRSNGPALVIRAEEERVLFVLFRGKRLREIEPRLKASGKYEMATIELREGERITAAAAGRLAREAVRLNRTLGDPTRRESRNCRARADGPGGERANVRSSERANQPGPASKRAT